jgi:hypothetical protein
MAYPPLSSSRRPRRRATIAILIIVGLVIGIIALAVRYRTERRDSVDYFALAKEIADDQVLIASGLADLFTTLGDLERPDILDRVSGLGAESEAMRKLLDSATVTAAVGRANGYLTVATASWDEALNALDEAIIEILDGEGDGRRGEVMLGSAFDDLRVGDRAYQLFRESLDDLEPDLVTRDYPDFGYVSGDREILYDAAVIANHLRTTLRFEENRDISVRATTEPEPLGSENGVHVVPDSDSFSVQVVVTNEGNVTAELITVALRLSSIGAGSEERSEIVAVLEPGEATTVLFADFVLVPGVVYELQLDAMIPDDDVPDNNVWELTFIRNEP